MGEIGISRNEYLYELTFCDIILIERGYVRRYRNLWSATRWQTFYTMKCSMADTSKLRSPIDLIKFPWEREAPPPISDDEIEEMLAEIDEINAQRGFPKSKPSP